MIMSVLHARPKFGFSHLSVAVFLVFARNVLMKLTGNTNFPTTAPLIPNLDAAIETYADAVDAALNRDKIKIAERNAKREIVENVLKTMAGIVMGVTSDREVLLTSGFEITDGRGPLTPVGQVQGLRYEFIPGVSGTIKFRWQRSSCREAALFVLEQTTGDPTSEQTVWTVVDMPKKCSCTITGLTPGVTYSWRVYGIGALGPGGKSEAISAMAI